MPEITTGGSDVVFEASKSQTILAGEALAHEGRAVVLVGMALHQHWVGSQGMRELIQGLIPDGLAIPSRTTYDHWASGKLRPAGLIQASNLAEYQITQEGVGALSLAGALFELSERYEKSALATTGKPHGDGTVVFARRIACIRATYEAIEQKDGEIELGELQKKLNFANRNDALSYIKRVAQTAAFSVDASTAVTPTTYEADKQIDIPLAPHASPLQRIFRDCIKQDRSVTFQDLFSLGVEQGELVRSEQGLQCARMILQGMERRGQVVRTEGKFSDGYVDVAATTEQVEYMADLLEVLDKYAGLDRGFNHRYGRYALDVSADKEMVGRILRRALTASGRRGGHMLDTDACVAEVLRSHGGPLCVAEVTDEIARRFSKGEIAKPVSVVTVRKVLNRLVRASAVAASPGKSNAQLFRIAD